MRDLIGRTLGHYRIVDKIGEGGMGEVYRAHDERLDRDVAIKVLPEEVAGVQGRLERFGREAKLLASLNHSNIATLHGLEREGNLRFLVMELVEGESLAAVIARGALPFDDALPIALQIAKALETAHESGVIHRDLKPANVMVGSDGQVKVLDFGLAKAFDPEGSGPQSPESIDESPTLTADLTRGGVLLGTAAYMSPEQASGKPVDKRADIWAFGCVSFEMLTGARAFPGTTSAEVLAGIIKEEPDWDGLPTGTLPLVLRLLRRCLTKDPRDRLHDIADARIELQSATIDDDFEVGSEPAGPISAGWRTWLPWGLATVFGLLAIGMVAWHLNSKIEAHAPKRFVIVPPTNKPLATAEGTDVAISPDGNTIAYVASLHRSSQLCVRFLDRLDVSCLAGTEGGRTPFFSPDGEWLGFFSTSDQKLKKLPISSGPSVPVEICDVSGMFSANWGPDDMIVFGSVTPGQGISRVSATGGDPTRLTVPSRDEHEISHDSPVMMSDSRILIFSIRREGGFDEALIVAQNLQSGERVTLAKGGTNVLYSPTGHIVYNRDGSLLAAPFNLTTLEVGTWHPVEDGIRVSGSRAGEFAISKEGTLVYVHGATLHVGSLFWADRGGEEAFFGLRDDYYQKARISPDGTRMAISVREFQRRSSKLLIYDMKGRVYDEWTFGGNSENPVWAPDSRRIAFVGIREGSSGIYVTSLGKFDVGEPIISSDRGLAVSSWSPDGTLLAYSEDHPQTKADIWLLSLQEGTASPLIATAALEYGPRFSPDGEWISYVSNESGKDNVYVQPVTGAGVSVRISPDGGDSPSWAPSGTELFYRKADKLFAVAVSTEPSFRKLGQPHALFEKQRIVSYNVHPDGNRFLMLREEKRGKETASLEMRLVLGWAEELARLVPKD
jgi:serine/threonine protein kinase/Tol biopolymer transport system component